MSQSSNATSPVIYNRLSSTPSSGVRKLHYQEGTRGAPWLKAPTRKRAGRRQHQSADWAAALGSVYLLRTSFSHSTDQYVSPGDIFYLQEKNVHLSTTEDLVKIKPVFTQDNGMCLGIR